MYWRTNMSNPLSKRASTSITDTWCLTPEELATALGIKREKSTDTLEVWADSAGVVHLSLKQHRVRPDDLGIEMNTLEDKHE
jgi:hypothetical protein